MPKKSFIKELLKRRIPQIIGSYIIAGTSLVLFIDWLTVRYEFPQYYVTLALFGIISIIPSVIILAYFHGAPGKDQWTKIEKIGIPANILFIATMLFIGFKYDFWEIEKVNLNAKPTNYLIHISSLKQAADIYEKSNFYKPFIKGRKLKLLNRTFLDSIRKNLRVQLMSEYYNSKKEFTIPTSAQDIEYLKDYNITIADFGDDSLIAIDSIYNRFNDPENIFTINLFRLIDNSSIDGQEKYAYFLTVNCALPEKSCWADFGGVDFVDIENQLLTDIRGYITKNKTIGKVVKINEDIISVQLTNLNIKEDMILSASTVFDFTYGNGAEIGNIDCQDGIKYYEGLGDSDNDLLTLNKLFSISFVVKKEYHNKGIGTKMLLTIEDILKLCAAEYITAKHFKDNIASHKAFLKAGYDKWIATKDYYLNNGKRIGWGGPKDNTMDWKIKHIYG